MSGRRAGVAGEAGDGTGVIRFGPEKSAESAQVPEWADPRSAERARKPKRGRLAIGFVLGLGFAVAAVFLISRASPEMRVVSMNVTPATQSQAGCAVVMDIVGSVTTNGRPGTITYQWVRSDGEQTPVLTQVAADGGPTTVHLLWTLNGKGTFPATATLKVLEPNALEAAGKFTYSCK